MNKLILKNYTKGLLYALILTLSGVLLFAVVVKFASIPTASVKPVTQIIKVLSIFLGVYMTIKAVKKNAWLHGGVVGTLYTVLAFFLFSILDSKFSITSGLLFDTLVAIIVGSISAMLIRFRKKEF